MTRRKFKSLRYSSSPTSETIARRQLSRRIFRELNPAGATEPKLKSVTIKAFDTADGSTIWEYGPGLLWEEHYSVDKISGIQFESGSLNKFVLVSGIAPSRPLTANCSNRVKVVQLDSTDGSVLNSNYVSGLFIRTTTSSFGTLLNMQYIGNESLRRCGLSGGNFVMGGHRLPSIEFVGLANTTANKSYVFNEHTQQGGNIYVRTKTSNELISITHNTTAAALKTALEATADVVSATCTGGPWPYAAIDVDIIWSVASGDIRSLSTDSTYSVTDGVTTIDRNVRATMHTIDPASGALVNAVGHVFGVGSINAASRLISGGLVPVPLNPETGSMYNVGAAGSDKVVVSSTGVVNNGTVECWTVDNPWTFNWKKIDNLSDGIGLNPRIQDNNALVYWGRKSFTSPTRTRAAATIAIATGTVTEYDKTDYSNIAGEQTLNALMADGAPTTLGWSGDERRITDVDYPRVNFEYTPYGEEFDLDGDKLLLGSGGGLYGFDTNNAYGPAAYSAIVNGDPPPKVVSPANGSSAHVYTWTFYAFPKSRLETGTEFRFRFGQLPAQILYSNWVDWKCTAAQLEAAIIAGIGENTEGVRSSVDVHPFGAPVLNVNNPSIGILEAGCQILFYGGQNATAYAFNFKNGAAYFAFQKIAVEVRNETGTFGITAWSRTDGSVVWNRSFGTSTATGATVYFADGWLRDGSLYLYGGPVEPE